MLHLRRKKTLKGLLSASVPIANCLSKSKVLEVETNIYESLLIAGCSKEELERVKKLLESNSDNLYINGVNFELIRSKDVKSRCETYVSEQDYECLGYYNSDFINEAIPEIRLTILESISNEEGRGSYISSFPDYASKIVNHTITKYGFKNVLSDILYYEEVSSGFYKGEEIFICS